MEQRAFTKRFDKIGLECKRLAIGFQRLLVAAQIGQQDGAVIGCAGVIGLACKRTVEMLQGLLGAPAQFQRIAAIDQGLGAGRIDSQRRFQHLKGFFIAALLQPEHAQKLAGEEAARIALQYLQVKRFSLRQPALLVKPHGLIGEGLKGHGGYCLSALAPPQASFFTAAAKASQ